MATWHQFVRATTGPLGAAADDGILARSPAASPLPLDGPPREGATGEQFRRWTGPTWYLARNQFLADSLQRAVGARFDGSVQTMLQALVTPVWQSLLDAPVTSAVLGFAPGKRVAGSSGQVQAPGARVVGRFVADWSLAWLGLSVLRSQLSSNLSSIGAPFLNGAWMLGTSGEHLPSRFVAARELAESAALFTAELLAIVCEYAAVVGMSRAVTEFSRTPTSRPLARLIETNQELRRDIRVSFWLRKLAIPRKPAMVRKNLATALDFLEPLYPETKLLGYLKGIDLSKPVRRIRIQPPAVLPAVGGRLDSLGSRHHVLVQFHHERYGVSNYFTWLRGGAPLTRLGIASGNREMRFYVVKRPVEALESIASPVNDTWTTPGQLRVLVSASGKTRLAPKGEFVGGGGLQLILPVQQDPDSVLIELGLAE